MGRPNCLNNIEALFHGAYPESELANLIGQSGMRQFVEKLVAKLTLFCKDDSFGLEKLSQFDRTDTHPAGQF